MQLFELENFSRWQREDLGSQHWKKQSKILLLTQTCTYKDILPMKHSEAFVKLVDDAKLRVKEIQPEDVLEKQNGSSSKPLHFVDVREDREWNEGHAKGAIHIGRGVIERDIEKLIPNKDELVILYCGGGFRSALAADNIQKMGYTNVLSMAGGMRLWKERDYPLESWEFFRFILGKTLDNRMSHKVLVAGNFSIPAQQRISWAQEEEEEEEATTDSTNHKP